MGRPRIDSAEPTATDRIYAALWELLEDNQVKDITISMVASKAGCNRGTFYYHFKDMDDLLSQAIERDLMGGEDGSYALAVFRCLTAPTTERLVGGAQLRMARKLCLLGSQGGMEMVDTKMKEIILGMWRDILCEEGQELSFESRLIIEYSVAGLISLFSFLYRLEQSGEPIPDHANTAAIQSIARIQLACLARCEGVEPTEMLSRLRMYDKLHKTKK